MLVEDLIEKMDFHDSSIIELLHEGDEVKIKVSLCMWKQGGYEEGDSELKDLFLIFHSVEEYMWDSAKAEADVDYDTILDVSYNFGHLKIVLADDGVSIISFKCKTVEFAK